MKAYIDMQKCPAEKGLCKPLLECAQQAITWEEDDGAPLGASMLIIEEKCKGCGDCIPLCCGGAIELR